MTLPPVSLLAVGEPAEVATLVTTLGLGSRRPPIAVRTASPGEARALARAVRPDVVLIPVGEAAREVLGTIEALACAAPTAMLVAVTAPGRSDAVLRVMRAGADDVLISPTDAAGMSRILAKLTAIRGLADARRPRGALWTIVAPKEGVGATTLAANLGIEARRAHGLDVALVDFDFRHGDLALLLNVDPPQPRVDITRDPLDPVCLHGSLLRHASGVSLLPAAADLGGPIAASGAATIRVLDLLRATHDLVIVDAPPPPTAAMHAAVTAATRVLVPTEATVPCLRAACRTLDALAAYVATPAALEVVVTRHGEGRGDLTLEEVRQTLGLPVRHLLPRDEATAGLAVNGGLALADVDRTSPLRQAIASLGRTLVATGEREEPRRKGLLGLLLDH